MNMKNDFGYQNTSYKLQMIVEGELDKEEELLWQGQPNPKRLMLYSIPVVLFGIPWTAFALFWMWGASGFSRGGIESGPGMIFPLFGLPFVFIGLGMLSAPYWALRKGKGTVYVVTDKRAIIFQKGWGTKIQSIRPEKLLDITKKIRGDGSGDLIFSQCTVYSRDSSGDMRVQKVGFLGVERVNEVEDILEKLHQGSKEIPE